MIKKERGFVVVYDSSYGQSLHPSSWVEITMPSSRKEARLCAKQLKKAFDSNNCFPEARTVTVVEREYKVISDWRR